MNIAVIHNSALLRQFIIDVMEEHGHSVQVASSNPQMLIQNAEKNKIDIAVLGDNLSTPDEKELSLWCSGRRIGSVLLTNGRTSPGILPDMPHNLSISLPKPDPGEMNDSKSRNNFFSVLNSLYEKCVNSELQSKSSDNAGPAEHNSRRIENIKVELIVIASSTGGPNALKAFFGNLPAGFNIPIAVVQHLEAGHEDNLAKWLSQSASYAVRIAKDGDVPEKNTAVIATQGLHLIIREGRYYYEDSAKVNFQKPAADKLFFSAAGEYKAAVIGIVLTGMGADGGAGAAEIVRRGGYTIVQDESTSTVFGMPKAAIERNGASVILPLDKIAPHLVSETERRNSGNG